MLVELSQLAVFTSASTFSFTHSKKRLLEPDRGSPGGQDTDYQLWMTLTIFDLVLLTCSVTASLMRLSQFTTFRAD